MNEDNNTKDKICGKQKGYVVLTFIKKVEIHQINDLLSQLNVL